MRRQVESGGWVKPAVNGEITAFEARPALNSFAINFYKIHRVGWGRQPEAMRRHLNRALPLDPGHCAIWPPWPEAALFYIRRDIAELWNCLAPNTAI